MFTIGTEPSVTGLGSKSTNFGIPINWARKSYSLIVTWRLWVNPISRPSFDETSCLVGARWVLEEGSVCVLFSHHWSLNHRVINIGLFYLIHFWNDFYRFSHYDFPCEFSYGKSWAINWLKLELFETGTHVAQVNLELTVCGWGWPIMLSLYTF